MTMVASFGFWVFEIGLGKAGKDESVKEIIMSGSVWGSGCGSVGRALLPTPEIGGSNLFTGKILSTNLSTKCVTEKLKIK